MKLTAKSAAILLALVISARATSFMFSKICLETMTVLSLISVRFVVATLIMLIFFHKRIFSSFCKSDAAKGFLFGTLYFSTLYCECRGLCTTDSGTAAFIENMAIVIVPLAQAVLRRRLPSRQTLIRAFLAVTGVALLTLRLDGIGGGFFCVPGDIAFFGSTGEFWLVAAACLYAAAIIVTGALAPRGNAFAMGFSQIATIALWATLFGLCSGEYTLPQTMEQGGMIIVLAVVCTCFGFTLQPVAQSKVTPERAALFCALSPVVAGVLGVVFLQEPVTVPSVVGELLILAALLGSWQRDARD